MTLHPDDTIRVRDIELCFRGGAARPPESSDKLIYVHKGRPFVSRMDAVLSRIEPRRMVEVGILDGGSTIYWQYMHQLECLIAFELSPSAPCLTNYLQRNQLTEIHPHFGASQSDGAALRAAILNDTSEPIDAVIDDASHMYAETRATVETLLPFVRHGGVYIIEDWAWGHHCDWQPDWWTDLPLMSPLLVELMLVCGYSSEIIQKVEIDTNFIVLWRGNKLLPQDGSFKLTDHYVARGFSVAL